MRIAILSPKAGWHSMDLQRAARSSGHEAVICPWTQVLATVDDDGTLVACDLEPLHSMDAVLVRTMPAGSLEQIVLRMDMLHRLAAIGVRVVNSPRTIEAAVDKFLSLSQLKAAGLPVPGTVVCQRYSDAMGAFDALGRDVVVKPIFGSEGFGMTRVTDTAGAQRLFTMLEAMRSVMYVQRFVPHHGYDLRLFVLEGKVLASMKRTGTGGEWRTNIAQGGQGEPYTPTPEQVELALTAAKAVGAHVSGVDLLPGVDGKTVVLEVNAVPGWRAISQVCGIDVASRVVASLSTHQ
ncbi:MAG: RimK family alpha-L-glutamate ligase [Phycisphaera sp.]|nr:RimK family alpha-L-glutamate ligase [Phycisphaera sp.]